MDCTGQQCGFKNRIFNLGILELWKKNADNPKTVSYRFQIVSYFFITICIQYTGCDG